MKFIYKKFGIKEPKQIEGNIKSVFHILSFKS